MKKITISLLLVFGFALAINAQDVKKLRAALTLAQLPTAKPEQLESAKTEVDKLTADAKGQNSAEAWALKTQIYGLIAANENLKAKYPNADVEGLAALKKYLELEPSEKILKEDRYQGVNQIYASLFNTGVKLYNEKNWEPAFDKFKNVTELSDILISRKWSNSAFDTTAHLYAGVTAQNAKKEAEAAKYYGALANQKVKGPDYESLYEFLTKYYLNSKNETEFKKYVSLAKEAYPTNDLWSDLEFVNQTKNAEPADMLKRFNEDDAAGKLSSSNYFDYGNIFVSDKKIRDMDAAKRTEFTNRAIYAFSKAYEKDTTNALASYNVGVTTYAQWEEAFDAARQIKGTTADIKAKRAAADKLADAAADKSLVWMERAFNSLAAKTTRTNLEKGTLSKSTDLLYNLYAYKKDRSKVLNPKDYDRFEAKAKFYDGLHGKY
jgi:hypothetical protein